MKECRWRDVCVLSYGKALRDYIESPTDGTPVRVFGTNGPIGWTFDPLCSEPGIIVGRKGAYRGIHYSDSPFFVIDTAYYLKLTSSEIDIKWAYYKLLTVNINRMDVGAAIPTTNRDEFYALPLCYPNKEQQILAASILSAYDDLIENNRRRIQLLERAARLLYQEWFVRLRFPGHEHVKIKDGVPEGWLRGKVGDVAEVRSGFAFKSRDWKSEGNPVIKIKNIVGDGTIDINSCDCIDDSIVNETSKFLIEPGSLLIAMTGATIGKVGLMPRTPKNYYLNQRVGKFLTCSIEKIEYFLYQFFFMDGFAQTQVQNIAAGAAQPNISGSQIESIELLIPQIALLTIFLDSVREGFQMRENLIEQNEKLKKARDLLLPRLMNGEIAV
jgi:type I restriction enzyme, S subunit